MCVTTPRWVAEQRHGGQWGADPSRPRFLRAGKTSQPLPSGTKGCAFLAMKRSWSLSQQWLLLGTIADASSLPQTSTEG